MAAKLKIDENTSVLIKGSSNEEYEETGFSDDVTAELKESFSEALDTMKAVGKRLQSIADEIAPDEMSVTYGLSIGAEGKIFLVGAVSTEAQLSVTFAWKANVSEG